MKILNYFVSLILCLVIFPQCKFYAHEPKKIIVWHSMDYDLGKTFNEIVTQFNQQQSSNENTIEAIYKGNYDTTLAATLQAAGTAEQPHIAQIFEMGTLSALAEQQKRSIFIPAHTLINFNTEFIPSVAEFYKAHTNQLNSVPFNSSTVIMYYNATMLKQAGIKTSALSTWEGVVKTLHTLQKNNFTSGLAYGWLTGHGIDQLAARHNIALANNGNGVDAHSTTMLHSNNALLKHNISILQQLYSQQLFSLKVGADAEADFAAGKIAILTQGANRVSLIQNRVNNSFEIGICSFPYWEKFTKKAANTIAGGASFWTLAGHPTQDYATVKKFLQFLISPAIQYYWHTKTGYVPVIPSIINKCKAEGFYDQSLTGKAAHLGVQSLIGNKPEKFSRGILLPHFPEIRKTQIEWMTKAIVQDCSIEEALKAMDTQASQVLNT